MSELINKLMETFVEQLASEIAKRLLQDEHFIHQVVELGRAELENIVGEMVEKAIDDAGLDDKVSDAVGDGLRDLEIDADNITNLEDAIECAFDESPRLHRAIASAMTERLVLAVK